MQHCKDAAVCIHMGITGYWNGCLAAQTSQTIPTGTSGVQHQYGARLMHLDAL